MSESVTAKWVTMRAAADHLGVSTKTIRRRIIDGTIKAKKFGPRLIRVDMSTLEQSGASLAWGMSGGRNV